MSIQNGLIAITVLLNLSQLHTANAALKSFNQSYYYPEKYVTFNNYAIKEGILVYAVCDRTNIEKNCEIIQRRFPYDKDIRSCNVTLQIQNLDNDNFTEQIPVHAFGKDNAILFWGEVGPSATFNLLAIQMDTCKIRRIMLDDPNNKIFNRQNSAHLLVTYNDEFDLFYDRENSTNGNMVGIHVSIDHKPLHTFDLIEKSEDKIRFVSPIATRSTDKGSIYITTKPSGDTLWMIRPDGTKKLLLSYPQGTTSTSANYGYITSCEISKTEYLTMCTQFDATGEITFKVNVTRKFNEYFYIVHTIPNGGFLIVTYSPNRDAFSYDVIKVDSEGKELGRIRSIGEIFTVKEIFGVWESENGYCITFVRQENDGGDDLRIDVHCFSDNDFTM